MTPVAFFDRFSVFASTCNYLTACFAYIFFAGIRTLHSPSVAHRYLLQPYISKVVSIDFILDWQESLKWFCKWPQYRQKTGMTKDAYYDCNKDQSPSSSSSSLSYLQSLDALSQWWAAMRGVIRYCKKISMGYNFQNGVIRQKNVIFLKTSWKFQHNGGNLFFKMD